jgi:carbamoyl-phosphate synthase large subunit
MGVDADFGLAFAKSQQAAGMMLPLEGVAFVSVRDQDKGGVVEIARMLHEAGISLVGTEGTVQALEAADVPAERIKKVSEGRPNIVDAIINGEIGLVINTPKGAKAATDSSKMRRAAVQYGVPYYTTLAAASAAVRAILAMKRGGLGVAPLQEYLEG